MRPFILIATFFALSISASPMAMEPRPAPEFKGADPNGNPIVLSSSSYKGKVTVVEFFLTTCQHCQRFSQMLTNLYRELGPQGLQAIGVAAFNANTPVEVASFAKNFGVGFPLAVSVTREAACAYLGHSVMSPVIVPQVIVIDKKGVVRAVTPPDGESELRSEAPLRSLIKSLLDEGAGAGKKTAGKKVSK